MKTCLPKIGSRAGQSGSVPFRATVAYRLKPVWSAELSRGPCSCMSLVVLEK